jgi:PAS domain S-box-containing protein
MQIEKSKEITRLILDSSPDAIVCINREQTISFWSNQAEKIFGWNESEVLGKNLRNIILPESKQKINAEEINYFDSSWESSKFNKLVEIDVVDKSGRQFPAEVTISQMMQDDEEFFCAFIRDISVRRKSDDEVRKEKELSEFVFENLPGIFYVQDQTGKYLRWNKNFEKASGYTAEEIENLNPMDFFHKDEQLIVKEAIDKVFSEGKAEVIADVITKDKRVLPFYLKAKSIIYDGEKCLIGSGIDLSKQQRAQKEVKRSEEKYRALFEQASDPIMVTDFKGKLLDVNESLGKMFGYTKGELMGKSIRELIDPENIKEKPMDFTRLAAGEHIFTRRRMMHRDGHFLEVEANLKKVTETTILGIVRDITESVRVQSELSESENRLRTIFETEPECIKLLDSNCKVLDMNPAGLAILEAENRSQVIGQNALDLVDEDFRENFINLNKNVFHGKSGTLEFTIRTLKNAHRWMEMHAVPLRNNAGEVISALSVARDITERKIAEDAFRQSRERYKALVENATEALVVFDVKSGKFESVSQSSVDFFKMSKEELLQIGPLELSPKYQPDGKLSSKKAKEKINEAIEGGKPNFEWIHIDKFGNEIPCEIYLVRLPSDSQILIKGSIFNITERKKTEEAIRLSEQKYKLLFNENPLSMFMLSIPDLNFIDVNDSAIAQYGYSKEEFLNMTAYDLRPKNEVAHFKDVLENRSEGKTDFGIWNHLRKDGSIIKVEVRAHIILNEGKPVWLALTNDVTERLLAEEKLKASEYQFRKVTENEILGVAWATPDGRILNANSTFKKMLGYSMDELKGLHFAELTHPEDVNKELTLVEEIVKGKRDFYQIEKRYKTSKENFIWVELSLSTFRNSESNEIEFFIGIVQNIHERKMAEQEIRKSHEELRQLSSYLETIREEERTNIAREIHDELGQQLTGLKMDISWLNKKIPKENKIVQDKISGMLSLVDTTVKTVRRISTELRPGILDDLGLIDALQWQSHEFEKRTGILCSFSTTFTEPSFEKHLSTGIFRVFQETLTNVARHAHASEIMTVLEKRDDNIILQVHDNGDGFNETEIKGKKTLGLIGMKERAKMFGGNLSVQSAVGKGTKITLQVPMRLTGITEGELIK